MTGTLIVPIVDEGLGNSAVTGRPVVLMCGHGERATTAASVLERPGHSAVAVLTGGPPDWAEATGGRLE
jgi:hydroxyacylglutathione hydrolase